MQDNLPKGYMVDPLGSANRPWLGTREMLKFSGVVQNGTC